MCKCVKCEKQYLKLCIRQPFKNARQLYTFFFLKSHMNLDCTEFKRFLSEVENGLANLRGF